MRTLLTFVVLVTLSFTIYSQTAPSKKLDDIKEAKAKAKRENKQILMVFAGSDWCKPCIQFKKEILENETFQQYAKDRFVVLYLDFPMRKKNKLPEAQTKHNEELAEKYNTDGVFPKILVMDATEKAKGELYFRNQGANNFIEDCRTLLK